MQITAYAITRTLDAPFDDVVQHVTDSLAAEGFGVLTTIDVQATMKDVIGRVYLSLGMYDPSRRLLSDALKTRMSRARGPDEQVAQSLDHMGLVLQEQGLYDESETQLRAGLQMRRELFGDSHEDVAESLGHLSRLAQIKTDLARAEAAGPSPFSDIPWGMMGFGLLCGAVMQWFVALRHKVAAQRLGKDIARLKGENAELRAQLAQVPTTGATPALEKLKQLAGLRK